jgi:TonB family protein
MTESASAFDQSLEAARVALGSGDRSAAEQALLEGARIAERSPSGQAQLAAVYLELGALKHDAGADAEAEELFQRALDLSAAAYAPDDLGLVPALTNLAAIRIARGSLENAEPPLTRALAISERHLGADHPDLAGLLNDLSRLYLKRSAHALAEPLLQRLHAIKRAKGDDHPEVATVLASLAAVRQALGRHEAAEQLWRRVVEIRERTLAPNHFAIATAIEHLAETCAARGKLDESLRLLQRAVGMREVTLGGAHPSLRVLRERIADLRLQASDEGMSVEPSVGLTVLPERRPAPLAMTASLIGPAIREPADPPRQKRDFTNLIDDLGPADAALAREQLADASPREDPRSSPLRLVNVGAPGESSAPLVMPAYADDVRRGDAAFGDDEFGDDERDGGRRSAGATRRKRRALAAAGVGITALALLAVGVTTSSLAGTDDPAPRANAPATADPFYTLTQPVTDSLERGALAANGDVETFADGPAGPASQRTRSTTDRTTTGRDGDSRPEPEVRNGDRAPGGAARAATTPARPTVPAISVPALGDLTGAGRSRLADQLDSLTRGGAASTAPITQFTAGSSASALGAGSRPGAFQAPQLIGALPRTTYPPSLQDHGVRGEVIVEFVVDTLGRPDLSTLKVMRSAHELFTNSVTEVLPKMRFVPAQSRGVKVPAPVQIPFRFGADLETP